MSSIMSPPQRLFLELAGQLLAVSPAYFRQLAFWAPRLAVRAVGDRRRPSGTPAGITLLVDPQTAAAWTASPAVPEPTILYVDGKRIGVIDVTGFLTKSDAPGRAGLVTLREQLQELATDGDVDAILLRIDSPGGSVAGTGDLAAAILQTRQTLPVFALIEDVAAVSAYWIASQAERVYANVATAIAGEIGTFIALYDRSEQFGKAGVKAIVIKAGELKAAGLPGTEITAKHREYLQGLVDKTQAEFNKAVQAGRKIDPRKVATGRLYLAGDAVKLGLIDGVKPFDSVMAELASRAGKGK